MEYESDAPDSDDGSICNLDYPDGPEDDVECCIVATFSEELGIPCQKPHPYVADTWTTGDLPPPPRVAGSTKRSPAGPVDAS